MSAEPAHTGPVATLTAARTEAQAALQQTCDRRRRADLEARIENLTRAIAQLESRASRT